MNELKPIATGVASYSVATAYSALMLKHYWASGMAYKKHHNYLMMHIQYGTAISAVLSSYTLANCVTKRVIGQELKAEKAWLEKTESDIMEVTQNEEN